MVLYIRHTIATQFVTRLACVLIASQPPVPVVRSACGDSRDFWFRFNNITVLPEAQLTCSVECSSRPRRNEDRYIA